MALLTRSDQEKVVSLLIEEGLVNREQTEAAKAEADQKRRPLIAALVDKRIATDAMIAHATAVVVGIPYVNLKGWYWRCWTFLTSRLPTICRS